MKRKMQMALSLVLALVFVFVTACGNSNNEGGKNKETNAPGNSTNSPTNAAEPEKGDPITIRIASGDANPSWDDMKSDVGQFIVDKTGITIKQEFPVGGSDTDMFALMVASDEFPDMVMPKGSAGKLVDAGALIDLRPLIEEHAPNLKRFTVNTLIVFVGAKMTTRFMCFPKTA